MKDAAEEIRARLRGVLGERVAVTNSGLQAWYTGEHRELHVVGAALEQRMRLMFRHVPRGYAIWDGAWRFTYTSDLSPRAAFLKHEREATSPVTIDGFVGELALRILASR